MNDHEIFYSTGLQNYELPPLIARPQGNHLVTTDIGGVDYIAGSTTAAALTTTTPTANNTLMYASPFVSPNFPCKIDQIQFEVTAVQATAEGYIGVFENADMSSHHLMVDCLEPGKTVYASSAQQCNTGNGLRTVGSLSLQLKPNRIYWMVLYLYPQLATNVTLRAMNTSQPIGIIDYTTSISGGDISMSVNSSVNPGSWGDYPRLHGGSWVSATTFPVMRYRLIP